MGTKDKIQAVALDLFAEKGLSHTSMRDIADTLGLTKPALYYHFASRDDLVRSIVMPLIDGLRELLDAYESAAAVDRRALLEAYFDLTYQHRRVGQLVIRDPNSVAGLGIGDEFIAWTHRMGELLVGPDAGIDARARAVLAIGGMSDCTVMFDDVPVEQLRPAVVNAACAALGC